jgi:hypothetical protein
MGDQNVISGHFSGGAKLSPLVARFDGKARSGSRQVDEIPLQPYPTRAIFIIILIIIIISRSMLVSTNTEVFPVKALRVLTT